MAACAALPFFANTAPDAALEEDNQAAPTSHTATVVTDLSTRGASLAAVNTAQPEAPTSTPRPTATAAAPISSTLPISDFTRIGPKNFPDHINPLTGLPVPNPALLDRRVIAAKIPNYPHSVRPQSGISLADQIYEYYLEWGLTRFLAIFYGNDAARFGPIRSARLFDDNIVRMYNAIFVFNGADKRVLDYYEERELDPRYFVVERLCPPLCRDETIPSYNNLFGNTAQVHEYVAALGAPDDRRDLSGNFFSSLSGLNAPAGTDIYINYSYANYAFWRYHEGSGLYMRYQGNVDNIDGLSAAYELHMDALTGQPLSAANVIVLMVPHDFYLKSSDTEIFSIDLTGSGAAYVFRDNQAFEARWLRFAERKPLAILDTDGRPFPLKPGVTFFQVMSTTTEVSQLDEQTWEFNFARPPLPDEE